MEAPFVASYLGQNASWYRPNESASLLGAIMILVVWGLLTRNAHRAGYAAAHSLSSSRTSGAA